MDIAVSGQHFEIGSSLQEYVKERIEHTVNKYFEHAISVHVHFVKEQHNNFYRCEIIVNEGTGRHITLKSDDRSTDIYTSFDLALTKMNHQLRKYKSKLSNKSGRMRTAEAIEHITAIKYIVSPEPQEEDDHQPLIIAETTINIPQLSISDAIMKMDLEGVPAVAFKNLKTSRTNVVYYRTDGNVAWIDLKE